MRHASQEEQPDDDIGWPKHTDQDTADTPRYAEPPPTTPVFWQAASSQRPSPSRVIT